VWLLDQTAVLVETSISFADFGEHIVEQKMVQVEQKIVKVEKKMAVINLA
jgi:hypothetical protein